MGRAKRGLVYTFRRKILSYEFDGPTPMIVHWIGEAGRCAPRSARQKDNLFMVV